MAYRAPVDDIAFWLNKVAGLETLLSVGAFPDLSADLAEAVLTEAGRFATEEIAPLNRLGDTDAPRLADGVVTLPERWRAAYAAWAEGGWTSLTGDPAYGGQGLPMLLYVATLDMWNGASTAFATGPMLTMGAIEALEAHGTDEQKRLYLEPLIAGRWTGSMNITEPGAGSDLSGLRARAEPAGDGSYRLFGQKIFISYGEHDLTDNIVHLVLARLPDAPAGTRGLSLFLVPKFLVEADGSLGARNDLKAVGLEHKLGLHGSPTCVMQFGERDGAIGWLVGEPHRGLAAMFTMMNNARLAVGIQGVGVAERAYQRALAFAADRRQGRVPGVEGSAPIIHHPDVRRMLLTARGLTDAARGLCYCLAAAIDLSRAGPPVDRAAAAERVALLTPVAKAFASDIGVEVASLGIQIHGGMGYIEETGAAQDWRDARILPIYEGTNGIQAIDLVTRKLTLADGHALKTWLAEQAAVVEAGRDAGDPAIAALAERAGAALDDLAFAAHWLQRVQKEGRSADALAGATPFLRLFALAAGGALHLKAVLADAGSGDASPAAARRRAVARFYVEDILTAAGGLRAAATAGAGAITEGSEALLLAG